MRLVALHLLSRKYTMNEDYYILPNFSEPVTISSVPFRGSIDIYEEIASGKRLDSANQMEPIELQQTDTRYPGKSEFYLDLQSLDTNNKQSKSVDIGKPSLHQNRPLPDLPSDCYDSSKSPKTSCKSKFKCTRIIFAVLGFQTVVIITLVLRLSTLKSKTPKAVTATTSVENTTSTYNETDSTVSSMMTYSTTKTKGKDNITLPNNGTKKAAHLTLWLINATTKSTPLKKKETPRRPKVINSTEGTNSINYSRN